ncbi:MAG: NAD(P)-dependent oxidoreductase, partial [Candidatus Omnitrophica bacterium]|nr:NAD(P)-dependent oxidoreductase [Candidatus Omnitrophota bacterium]
SSSVYVYSDMGSFYRSSKQACELLIQNYQEEFGLEYTILRYGSLYGPRSSDNNWLHKVLKQALIEGKIIREGDGEEIREYIHVYDAARLSVDILEDEYKNRSFLLTGNEQLKIKDILGMIREMFKGKVEINYVPAKENSHYTITPYVFNPQMASKLKSNEHIDIGQGLLNILTELHKEHVISQS